MTSIQGAYSQLLGAAAGAATAGSYMIRQSDWYKAQQADKKVENINKALGAKDYESEKLPSEEQQSVLAAGERAVSLRQEALLASPTKKRAEAESKALRHQTQYENEFELQKAEQTIRDALLGNDLRTGKKNQTLDYQKALETVRDPRRQELRKQFVKEHYGEE